MEDSDTIMSLQSQVDSLRSRVQVIESSLNFKFQELLAENEKLSSRLSGCRCNQKEEKLDGSVANREQSVGEIGELKKDGARKSKKKVRQQIPGDDMRNMTRFCKRYVALKVMYFGQRFYGFASEAQMDPTVESEIFKALEKTRLAVGDRKELQYSRCGRTDKGVSSVGLFLCFLRSNLKENDMNNSNSGEHDLIEEHEGEIDYVGLLNRALPKDIRVIGWCPVPVDFSARFSFMSREYKYFFWRDNLDLLAMQNASKKFIGEHDFRNFCNMDALNVHNYRRKITYFEIFPSDVRFDGSQLYAIKIKGTAFLWHQVRCIGAVLFMIGQGLESPEVVDTLLDTEKTVRKPQYVMAPEVPLVLHSCEFEGLKFTCSSDAGLALRAHLKNECRTYHLQSAIFHEAVLNCLPLPIDRSLSHKVKTKVGSHVPLMSRPTEPSYDERHAKLSSRT